MSKWKEWKKAQGETRPWHIFDENKLVDDQIANDRYKICNDCPFFSITKQCKKCGCFMAAKTKLKSAQCPIGKW